MKPWHQDHYAIKPQGLVTLHGAAEQSPLHGEKSQEETNCLEQQTMVGILQLWSHNRGLLCGPPI